MKKSSIFGIVTIAVAIAIIICTYGSASTYGTFKDADNTNGDLHIIGHIDKQKEMVYDATKDANYFSFYLRDTTGNERKVVYHSTKPEDFETADKIVLVGQMDKGEFHAKTILMKCPSKYKQDKLDVKADTKKASI
ncbi:cytochrome c maturation protein CcmE domain-containing protein [Mucilaginibacter sp.]